MVRMRWRIPLGLQVGVVAGLFVAALVVLWTTGLSVVAREQRREEAHDLLDRAGDALAGRGQGLLEHTLTHTRGFPYYQEWDELDRRLGAVAESVLRRYEGVEGGYFVRDAKKFLGAAYPTEPAPLITARGGRHRRTGPPPREAELIEIQVDAAIRKSLELGSDQKLFVVEEVKPSTVAIRTAPVRVNGRIVAATWTMTRLVDPLFLERSTRGYQVVAGLALGGIGLAVVFMVGLVRTVRRQATERDRLQADLRRSERLAALGRLLAGVAHEVRNPLAGIRSTVQLWQRGIGPDAESFADLQDEVDRLEGIVARLLHFSRADAQELAPGDLNAVVTEAARLARGPAEAQGVRVELDLDPSLPAVSMAPPALIQVFRNLTTNALQAMPEGGALRMTTRLDPSGRRVEVSVADTGPGLPPDVRTHLFEPFYTTKAGGTGLGLAIAREIALAHRGELGAGPGPGDRGAVFTLSLPVAGPADHGGESDDARA